MSAARAPGHPLRSATGLLDSAVAFCDGAASGNPGSGGWGVVRILPRDGGRDAWVEEKGGSAAHVTNNQMELMAALEALRGLPSLQPAVRELAIYTDSTYVIRGITQWIWGWRQRGWLTSGGAPVANAELWKALAAEVMQAKTLGYRCEWRYVRGHVGIAGNERVDEIATQFARRKRAELYCGPLLGYEVAALDLPEVLEPLPEPRSSSAPKPAAHSYLSLVNGELMRHASWKDCEARVKGRPGAKFKKALSPADEATIASAWGVDLARAKNR